MDAAYAAFVAQSGEAASHTRSNSEERTLLLTQKPSNGNIMGMKITVLDAAALGEDLDLSPLNAVGDVTVWNRTAPDEVRTRITDCDAIILNKVRIGDEQLPAPGHAPRILCVAATGYDNIDIAACRARRIAVANVRGYSTDSVAQVTVGLVLALVSHLPTYCAAVSVGSRVAGVARAFGCRVLTCRRHPDGSSVSLETLLRESDIVTIHTPLTEETRGMIGKDQLALLRPGAILVNMVRGAVTDEAAVAEAILAGRLGGFGADVYSTEPFGAEHPFSALLGMPQVCLTPHMSWGALEARERCLREMILNMQAFFRGELRNRVDC